MAPKCWRVTLGTDLRHAWAQRLVDAGFVAQHPSIWIIEGLDYREPAAVERLLGEISAIAAPGSVLVNDLINLYWMKQFLKEMEERGMAWQFGAKDPAGLFSLAVTVVKHRFCSRRERA